MFFWNYCLWNLKTVPDYHPIPRILNVSDSLFGVLSFEPEKGISSDLFRQGKSNTTAFITPWALHEWGRLPFGLTDAPAEF